MGLDTLEIYRGRKNKVGRTQWRWRFRAANGNILANGGEGYANLLDLVSSSQRVLDISPIELATRMVGQEYRVPRRGSGSWIRVVFLDD